MNIPVTNATLRVLVVDDNREAALLIIELLMLVGHQCQAAFDGPDALQQAAAFLPDVVLLDLHMPAMDGYAVLRALQAIPAFAATPVVAFTAHNDFETLKRTREAGFAAHLGKPASLDAILDTMTRAITARAARLQ
ncbi:response regulator [Oxalobacteraceae bacterium A2-2]